MNSVHLPERGHSFHFFFWFFFFYALPLRFAVESRKKKKKDMAIPWFSLRTSWPRCPPQRWRETCWRWSSSPWPGWGCTGPWCVHAALWSAWRLGRCHLWTRPPHRGFGCGRSLHPPSSASPGHRPRIGPFCSRQTTREGRQRETGGRTGDQPPTKLGAVLRCARRESTGDQGDPLSPSPLLFAKKQKKQKPKKQLQLRNIF